MWGLEYFVLFGRHGERPACMIANQYFHGVPDLIAEVSSPATRAIDRGVRMEVYRRAGVPRLLLLDPELETVDVYSLVDARYRHDATHAAGETLRLIPSADVTVAVDALFDTQWKRHPDWWPRPAPEPVPAWLLPPETRLGLEYLLLLGHPERRREIWDNRVECVLAFGSEEEAQLRFEHFREDLGRWTSVDGAGTSALEPVSDIAVAPPFRLARRGHRVHLQVTIDARRYRELLGIWARRDAWDWGEETGAGEQ